MSLSLTPSGVDHDFLNSSTVDLQLGRICLRYVRTVTRWDQKSVILSNREITLPYFGVTFFPR